MMWQQHYDTLHSNLSTTDTNVLVRDPREQLRLPLAGL